MLANADLLGIWAVFGLTLIHELVLAGMERRGKTMNADELNMQKRIKCIAKEIRTLDPVKDYVKVTKSERSILKHKKELADLTDARKKSYEPSQFMRTTSTAARPALMVILGVLWWSSPLVTFPASRLWPFSRMFAIPGFPSGAVSAISWHIMVSRTCKKIFDVIGFTPKKKEASMLSWIGLG